MPHILKISVASEHIQRARNLPSVRPVVLQVDVNEEKHLARIVSAEPLTEEVVRRWIETPSAPKCLELTIDGMHCQSCEVLIEREWKAMPGIEGVTVSSKNGHAQIRYAGSEPDLSVLDASIRPHGYRIIRAKQAPRHEPHPTEDLPVISKRPSVGALLGLAVLVFLIGTLLSKLGLLKSTVAIGGSMTIGAAFLLGLFAASSSCLAVSGGLLLSTIGKVRRMQPVFLFVFGRILSYTILGGVIGLVGSSLLISPTIMGMLTVAAAFYMLVMGLNMLHLAPRWLTSCLPRMPKAISHRVFDRQGKSSVFAPVTLGAATFFLPCGFTQALQLYALTTGSAFTSALLLGAFALGTSPSLLALGFASSSLKGKAGTFFLQLSGVAVVLLGLWNIQNGLTILGTPLSLPKIELSQAAPAGLPARDPNVSLEDGAQVIRMSLTSSDPYYYPTNAYTVQAGIPVKIEIDGAGTGCRSIFQIPKLAVRSQITQAVNTVEFTPKEAGTFAFSCSMGMYRGQLNVVQGNS